MGRQLRCRFKEERVENTSLSKKDGYKIHHEWLELFANKFRDPNGKFKTGNYIWEAYHSGSLPSVSGSEGSSLYQSKPVEEYYVIYENGQQAFDCKSDAWPIFLFNEAIVFPKSKTWSAVFSHEGTAYYVEPDPAFTKDN